MAVNEDKAGAGDRCAECGMPEDDYNHHWQEPGNDPRVHSFQRPVPESVPLPDSLENAAWAEAERRYPRGSAYVNEVETRQMDFLDGVHWAEARLIRAAGESVPAAPPQFKCMGCGQWFRESELFTAGGSLGSKPSYGHAVSGSVPDYCGPVMGVPAAEGDAG